jgi:hypothetical protein
MMELTIDDKIKLLEEKLSNQKELVIKTSKYCNWKIIGKYFIPRLMKQNQVMTDIFRELRKVTREAYPERFIQS